MPTLNSSEEPDSYNMDYYYSKYRDRYGIEMNENNPSSLKVLPPSFNPESCDIQGTKKQHYFQVPEQPTIGTCYCKNIILALLLNFTELTIQLKLANLQLKLQLQFLLKNSKKLVMNFHPHQIPKHINN